MTTKIGPDLESRIAAAWPEMCADIEAGSLVIKAIGKHGFTRQHITAFLGRNPGARREWDLAKEASAESFMDMALETAINPGTTIWEGPDGKPLDKPLVIAEDYQHARTRIDTYKWAARIRNPRSYSDKSSIDLNVKTVDLTAIIRDANARLIASQQAGRVIAGEVVRRALDAPQHEDPAPLGITDLL